MNINEIISENISLKEKIALLENELTNIKQNSIHINLILKNIMKHTKKKLIVKELK